jgi:Ca2+-binding RTX toxin-like protein
VTEPLDLNFGIIGTDGDGDWVNSVINASLYPVTMSVEGNNSVNNLYATSDKPFVFGYDGNDKLYGDDGDNVLVGGAGNDELRGGKGNDILSGGAGDDILAGGIGSDVLTGGAGSDTLVFKAADVGSGVDTISGFTVGAGGDVLNVADVLAGLPGFNPGTSTPLSHLGVFLQFDTTTSPGNTTISVDMNGAEPGGAVVPLVTLQGVTTDLAALLGNGQIDYTP